MFQWRTAAAAYAVGVVISPDSIGSAFMDAAVWVSVAGAVISVMSALVAVSAARKAKRYGQRGERAEEHAATPLESTENRSLHSADHGSTNGYQPLWRFHRFATVTPTPLHSFSRWPISDEDADEERRLFDIQAQEAHEQQHAQQRYLLPLACSLVNETGETAWAAEWACRYESFLNEDYRGRDRPPQDVAPGDSLLTFIRRPPDNTEIVVTWYRRLGRAEEARQHWRGVLPTE